MTADPHNTLMVTSIVGHESDPSLSAHLHDLAHAGSVESVTLDPADLPRRRMRATTDRGAQLAIALPRDQRLDDGALLLIEPGRAIVVRVARQPWLAVRPRDAPAALELGYFCGNMHWPVRFRDGAIHVAVQGDRADYEARLAKLVADGLITIEPDDPNDPTPLSAAVDIPPHSHAHAHTHDHPHSHSHSHSHGHDHSHPHTHTHAHAAEHPHE